MIATEETMIHKVEKVTSKNGLAAKNPISKQRSIELEVISDVDSSMACSSSDLESESDRERVSEADNVEEEKKDGCATGFSSWQKSVNNKTSQPFAMESVTSRSNKQGSNA